MATCTFKPKAMSYTEYLRSKTAAATVVIDTRPKLSASDFTQRQRFAASQDFPSNGQRLGAVNRPIDLAFDPLRSVQSYQKTSGGKVQDASFFTSYVGGQAVGNDVQATIQANIQAGGSSNFITQTPSINIQSLPVAQTASDFTRQTQGCKKALGEQHEAATVTPSKFVDNTIRNQGDPALCTVPIPNHSVKEEKAFRQFPSRPSQAGGQLALKGNLAPGKDVGARGGNPNYKVGAAMRHIPVIIGDHHGNDMNVNPKRPFVKYQIPAGTPAHVKINEPTHYPVA